MGWLNMRNLLKLDRLGSVREDGVLWTINGQLMQTTRQRLSTEFVYILMRQTGKPPEIVDASKLTELNSIRIIISI